MGPKILRWRLGETEYVLSAVPFGGYVKMAGEGMMEEIQDTGTWEERKYPLGTLEGNAEAASLDEDIPRDRLFSSGRPGSGWRSSWPGPCSTWCWPSSSTPSVLACRACPSIRTPGWARCAPDTPAAAAGIAVGDSIVAVGGQPVRDWRPGPAGPGARGRPGRPQRAGGHGDRRPGRPAAGPGARAALRRGPGRPGPSAWIRGTPPSAGCRRAARPSAPACATGDVILSVDGEPVTSFGGVADIINGKAGRAGGDALAARRHG